MNVAVHINQDTASIESLIRQAFDVCTMNTESIRSSCNFPAEALYFLDVIDQYFDPGFAKQRNAQIIVFGTDFPMEIIHALTKRTPYWVIGGNRAFAQAADEFVPRDTDPVSRAALGQLLTMVNVKDDALVIVPCSSDAQRKIAYLLQTMGWKVVTLWIPAVQDEHALKAFQSELKHALGMICRHLHRRYSQFALDRSSRYVNSIRHSIHDFLDAARENENIMPGRVRMAVLDSFFMTDDVNDWHVHLKALTDVLKTHDDKSRSRLPRVLLIGSPIYFPNGKIPSLLLGAGVEICGSIDSRTGQYEKAFSGREHSGLSTLAEYYFSNDSSSAFISNDQLVHAIHHYVEETQPDGIIWHVLKGQIEYDFELARNENYFEQQDLPVIRLETDYQDQDVEQLRIRIEAFSELLTQKRTEKGAGIV